jgi:hypothetical protein
MRKHYGSSNFGKPAEVLTNGSRKDHSTNLSDALRLLFLAARGFNALNGTKGGKL